MGSVRTRFRADETRATGGVEPRGFPLQQPVGRQRERMPEDHAARQCQCDGAQSKPFTGISLRDKYSVLPVHASLPETSISPGFWDANTARCLFIKTAEIIGVAQQHVHAQGRQVQECGQDDSNS